MTQNLKRQENVAQVVHFQVMNLWQKPDFKRLTNEQLASPSLFARLEDIETTNYIRGLLRACGRETLTPLGLRITSGTNGKNDVDEARILLGEADGSRFLLVTSNETRGRFSHFKWEIGAYKDFKKMEPATEPIQRIASIPERKAPAKKDARVEEIQTQYGLVTFHREFVWIEFSGATYYATRREIVMNGQAAEYRTDVPNQFMAAVCEARDKNRELWCLARDSVEAYLRLKFRETVKKSEPPKPRERSDPSNSFAYNGGCFEFTCTNGKKCEFNYARSTIAVDDRVIYDHRQIPVEFLQELLGNLDMIPSHALGVFQATLRRSIKVEVRVAGSDLIRWAIRNRGYGIS
jgi:hypothetical protein